MRTKVTIEFHKKFNKYPKIVSKILNAKDHLEDAINSEEFRSFILNHEFLGAKCFADTSHDNEKVLRNIQEGSEKLNPELDYEYDYILIPYYSRKRVIGYTYPSRKEIWLNMNIYEEEYFTEADVAANLGHEQMHKLGYKHSFRRSWKWPFTVPYAVGSKIKEIVNLKLGLLNLEEVESGGLNHMSGLRRVWYKIINFIF